MDLFHWEVDNVHFRGTKEVCIHIYVYIFIYRLYSRVWFFFYSVCIIYIYVYIYIYKPKNTHQVKRRWVDKGWNIRLNHTPGMGGQKRKNTRLRRTRRRQQVDDNTKLSRIEMIHRSPKKKSEKWTPHPMLAMLWSAQTASFCSLRALRQFCQFSRKLRDVHFFIHFAVNFSSARMSGNYKATKSSLGQGFLLSLLRNAHSTNC